MERESNSGEERKNEQQDCSHPVWKVFLFCCSHKQLKQHIEGVGWNIEGAGWNIEGVDAIQI